MFVVVTPRTTEIDRLTETTTNTPKKLRDLNTKRAGGKGGGVRKGVCVWGGGGGGADGRISHREMIYR